MQFELIGDQKLKRLKEMIAAIPRNGTKRRLGQTSPELRAQVVAAWRGSKREQQEFSTLLGLNLYTLKHWASEAILTQGVDQILKLSREYTPSILPQSSFEKALSYLNRLWPKLIVFLTQPEVPLHTNIIEQSMRNPVIGRKNHLGSQSLETAQVASDWYSVIATCQLHNLNPRKYLEHTLWAIILQQLLQMPWEFKSD